jgi:hypothetical protein
MGLIYPGVPKKLTTELAKKYSIKQFVETGTQYGITSIWAAAHFDHVITIEASEVLFKEVNPKLSKYSNIEHVFGDSSTVLKKQKVGFPALFWLDAHYSGGNTFSGENPLMKEIDFINTLGPNVFIFIDDARFVTSKWRGEQFCLLNELIGKLKIYNRYIAIFEDVIIAVPEYAKESVDEYTDEMSEIYWEQYISKMQSERLSRMNVFMERINKKLSSIFNSLIKKKY